MGRARPPCSGRARGVLRGHCDDGDAGGGVHSAVVPAGQVGGLFREFGFVLAFSVGLSSLVAPTLCPMMASRMLTREMKEDHGMLGRFGDRFSSAYEWCLQCCLNARSWSSCSR